MDGITISMETYIKDMSGACGLAGYHRQTAPIMLHSYMLVAVDPGEQLDDADP